MGCNRGLQDPPTDVPADPRLGFVPARWTAHAAPPALGPGEVHIWSVSLDVAPGTLAVLSNTLSGPERVKADRFRFDRHRRRYIAARGLLRRLLGIYLDLDAAALEFRFGPRGKPSLPVTCNGQALGFNATDAEGQALFAVSWDTELGIDLECVPRTVAHDRIAKRHFAAPEVAALSAFPESERPEAFLACWTRKEAFGKAEGVGIHYPLDSVCLCHTLDAPSVTVPVSASLSGRRWEMYAFRPDFPGVAALVASRPAGTIRCLRYDS